MMSGLRYALSGDQPVAEAYLGLRPFTMSKNADWIFSGSGRASRYRCRCGSRPAGSASLPPPFEKNASSGNVDSVADFFPLMRRPSLAEAKKSWLRDAVQRQRWCPRAGSTPLRIDEQVFARAFERQSLRSSSSVVATVGGSMLAKIELCSHHRLARIMR
jgi:hypothetical protein